MELIDKFTFICWLSDYEEEDDGVVIIHKSFEDAAKTYCRKALDDIMRTDDNFGRYEEDGTVWVTVKGIDGLRSIEVQSLVSIDFKVIGSMDGD